MVNWDHGQIFQKLAGVQTADAREKGTFAEFLELLYQFSNASMMVYCETVADKSEYQVIWSSDHRWSSSLSEITIEYDITLLSSVDRCDSRSYGHADAAIPVDYKLVNGCDSIRVLLTVPVRNEEHFFGLLVFGWVDATLFSAEEKNILELFGPLFGQYRAKNEQLQRWQKQLSNLKTINRIYTTLHMTLSEEAVIGSLIEELIERGSIRGIVIKLNDQTQEKRSSFLTWGEFPDSVYECEIPTDFNAHSGEHWQATEADRMPFRIFDAEGFRGLCFMFRLKGQELGALFVFARFDGKQSEDGFFTPFQISLLQELSLHTAIALEHCKFYSESQKLARLNRERVWKFALIYEISYLFRETMSIEQRLHLILTAITLGDGMGFNRAILLMIDEKENVLRGMMGLGPSSGDEANRIWTNLKREERPYREWIVHIMQSKSYLQSSFHQQVQQISLPLGETGRVFAETVATRKALHVSAEDSEKNCPEQLHTIFKGIEFATAPLMSGERILGVIAVDNYYNRQPIYPDDVHMLELFAGHAGVSIEMSQLYLQLKELTNKLEETHQQLEQREKLSALGELSAMVAHEVRNPLVAIGGFARRLHSLVLEHSPDIGTTYTEIIIKEVDRLEIILQNILQLAREVKNDIVSVQLNDILDEILFLYESELRSYKIEIRKELNHELPEILGDKNGLKQVVINLINNAMHAMKDGGILTVRSFLETDEGEQVSFEIADTGGGIEDDIVSNIFNPFFTTKEKGIGLGLSLTHKIVERNKGNIRVFNRHGQGVTFKVRFPKTVMKRNYHEQ